MMAAPFFIVGAHRSGTTLLRLMLNSHPDLAVPPESHFIPRAYARRHALVRAGRVEIPAYLDFLSQQRRFRRWEVPLEVVRDLLRRETTVDLSRAVALTFAAYAQQHGKKRWGDKTPDYVLHIPLVERLFPDGRFVHLIRDGRDVAASFVDRATKPNIWLAAYHWYTRVTAGRQAGRRLGPNRYLEVRYESLVTQPEETLRQVCRFIDLSFDPLMLDYGRQVDRVMARRPSDRRARLASAVAPKRDWHVELTTTEIAAFEAVDGDLLTELGYALSGKPVPLGIRASARIMLASTAAWRGLHMHRFSRRRRFGRPSSKPGPKRPPQSLSES